MVHLIDINGTRGARDLGIPLNFTIREATKSHHIVRRHRADALNLVESALEQIIVKGFSESEDILLWRHGPDKYRPCLSSKFTWEQIRNKKNIG